MPGNDPCTVTGICAINEPGEGLVEMEITVGCSRASLWKDRPGEHWREALADPPPHRS
jgi:hypothetical protein